MYDQLYDYMNQYLNTLLCGFRKSYSTQHALFKIIQDFQKELDSSGCVKVILMDLSKAYDCLPHDLIIAKLEAYGLDKNSLSFIYNYLNFRFQRTKIGSNFSEWSQIIEGVPQESIMGPLLFNIHLNDIFLFILKSSICNFADDNTLYSCNKIKEIINENLKTDMKVILHWFKVNSLKANPEKFDFMIMGKRSTSNETLNINSININESSSVKLLGITLDNSLKFSNHIDNICRTSNFKLHALRRIRNEISQEKAIELGSAFIHSNFNYASIIWMFCCKTDYKKIKNIHYKSLKIIYQTNATYDDILEKYNKPSIHQVHLRLLATEIFKSINNLSPSFMKYFFNENIISYNLRQGQQLIIPQTKTLKYGIQGLLYRCAFLWNNLPNHIKESDTVDKFKSKLFELNSILCTCRICS